MTRCKDGLSVALLVPPKAVRQSCRPAGDDKFNPLKFKPALTIASVEP
jgi:hypothetical protein